MRLALVRLLALAGLVGLAGCAAAPLLAAPPSGPPAPVVLFGPTQCPLIFTFRTDDTIELSGLEVCREALRDSIIQGLKAPPNLNRGKEL
jgi:hypothetical protein